MDKVLVAFGSLQLAKMIFAAILTLRTHLSLRIHTEEKYNYGTSLLKAIALFSFSGLLVALAWLIVFFGDDLFHYRSITSYRWILLALFLVAEAPFFVALWVLWELMDAVDQGKLTK